VEIGIFYTPIKDTRLKIEKLGFVEFLLVAPPGHKGSLKTLPFVGSRQLDYSAPYPALTMLSELGLGIDPKQTRTIQSNLQETQKRLVMKGLGFSLLPSHMVQNEIDQGLLHAPSMRKHVGSPLYWVTKKGRPLSKPAEVFEEYFRARLSAQ